MAQQKTAIFHFRGSMDKKSDDFVLVCTRTATSQNRRGLRRFFACSTKATDSQPLMSGFFCSTTDSTDNTDKKYDSRRIERQNHRRWNGSAQRVKART